MATLHWAFDDDKGMPAEHGIHKPYYVKEAPKQILSPQHWLRMSGDNMEKKKGTWCAMYDNMVVLHWDQITQKCTIILDLQMNTTTLFSSMGFGRA